jgi:hypothetical protein
MQTFAFEALGLAVEVSGTLELVEAVSALYGSFPRPNAGSTALRLSWAGGDLTCWREGRSTPVLRDIPPPFRPAATTIVVGQLLTSDRPDTLFLHANAVASPTGRVILLAGDSGLGKSTLSRAILDAGGALIAEDLAPLGVDPPCVHAFPRAALDRTGSPAGAKWKGFGAGSEEKSLRRVVESPHTIRPLDGASLVLLESGHAPAGDAPPGPWTSWVTPPPTDFGDRLRAHGLPLVAVGPCVGGMAEVSYHRRLTSIELHSESETAHAAGVLILAREPRDLLPAGPIPRPPQPILAELTPSQAIPKLLPLLRRPDPDPLSPGSLFLALARLTAGLCCWTLTPGGTPGETVACLDSAGALT